MEYLRIFNEAFVYILGLYCAYRLGADKYKDGIQLWISDDRKHAVIKIGKKTIELERME